VQEETSEKPVDLETYLPQCLAHVERLIAEVDAASGIAARLLAF
jgi:hypothetical protein